MPMINDYFGWLQLALFMGLLLVLTRSTGAYLFRMLDRKGKTFLDPYIGLKNAFLQARRVAQARGIGSEALEKIIRAHTECVETQFSLGQKNVSFL